MKFLVLEAPHGGAYASSPEGHPHPHPERWRCTGDQRVEACYAFRDQPGGIYLIETASDQDLDDLLAATPEFPGTVREVWALREV